MASKEKVKLTAYKSLSGRLPKHIKTLKGLGIHRMHKPVVLEDTPSIRGMIEQVKYLLKVERG